VNVRVIPIRSHKKTREIGTEIEKRKSDQIRFPPLPLISHGESGKETEKERREKAFLIIHQ